MNENLMGESAIRSVVSGCGVGAGQAVQNGIPRLTIAGVDEKFLLWILFGLTMATLLSGVMATGTALTTVF